MDDITALFVGRDDSIEHAMRLIDRSGRGLALLVASDRSLEATITDGDIRRAILAGLSIDATMDDLIQQLKKHAAPFTASVDCSDAELLENMQKNSIRHLPLLNDDDKVVAVVLLDDLQKDETDLPVQAVIMAGGFGTRLRPFTDSMPKPMISVGGRPLMERTIERLQQAGIRRINVTTHYLPEKITGYFGNGNRHGVELNYVAEDQPLGTAGSLGLVGVVEEPLLVMNGDILTRVDFSKLLKFHREQQAALTVGVRQYAFEVPYGVVEAEEGIVSLLREKPKYNFLVNAGIYLLEPHVRRLIPPGERFDMTDLIDALLKNKETVASFPVVEYWVDIGQHADLKRVQSDVQDMRWAA